MFLWDLITSYYLSVMVLFCSKSCWQCLCLCAKHVWLSFLIKSLEFQNKLLIGAPSISRKKLPWLYENHHITTLVETYLALWKTNEGLATFLKKKKKKEEEDNRKREHFLWVVFKSQCYDCSFSNTVSPIRKIASFFKLYCEAFTSNTWLLYKAHKYFLLTFGNKNNSLQSRYTCVSKLSLLQSNTKSSNIWPFT